MSPNLPIFLVALAVAAFLIEYGNCTRIAAPDQPDRSASFVGTKSGANGPGDPGRRAIHSDRNPLF
jgi:hypothetical protein